MFSCGSEICGTAINGETTLVVVQTGSHPKIDRSTTLRRGALKYGDWGSLYDSQAEAKVMNHRHLKGAVRDFDMLKHLTLLYHEAAAKKHTTALYNRFPRIASVSGSLHMPRGKSG